MRIPILILIIMAVIPLVSAQLDCLGTGQAFMKPEYLAQDTISIPCSFTTLNATDIVNISCVSLIFFEDDLISTYPEITDIGLFGKSRTINLVSGASSASFVMKFKNRDLLNQFNFTWKVICKDSNFRYYEDSGQFKVEYPFAEPAFKGVMTIFQRDGARVIALMFLIILIIISLGFIVKMVFG